MTDRAITLAEIEAERDRQLDADLYALMSVDWGRRVAQWLIFDLGALQSVAMRSAPLGHPVAAIKDGDTADRHAAFHDGRRDMASDLYLRLGALNPAAVLEMQTEHMRATIAAHARLAPAEGERDE